MSGTYTDLLTHIIFSTKDRAPLITDRIREPLYQYIGGIVRAKRGVLLEVGGIDDHIHLLARFRPSLSIASAVRFIKSNSSKWLNEDNDDIEFRFFHWQLGYAAFSVSKSNVDSVRDYIRNQPRHHRRRSFKEELINFLEAHEVEYDERYVWD